MSIENDMPLNLNELISLAKFARLANISRQTIYNRLKNGTAPRHERIDGHYYFYRSDALKPCERPQ
jgi:predicted DNA-binding transcriptional regulator AlpA